MKRKIILLACYLLALTGYSFAQQQKPKTRNETYEWSHSWIVTKPDSLNLPNALLIGDSHVERYFPIVSEKLKGQFYCSKITSSKSLGDPEFIDQLKALLGSFRFDVIFFNNGLHGVAYSPEEYAKYLPTVYKLLKKNNPQVKIFWVTTTARRVPNNLDSFDAHNGDVEKRNKYVADFCTEKNISVIDFSSLSLQHKDYYSNDGIHFNETGVKEQASIIAEAALKCCKANPK